MKSRSHKLVMHGTLYIILYESMRLGDWKRKVSQFEIISKHTTWIWKLKMRWSSDSENRKHLLDPRFPRNRK
jgi:hypothetical protein